MNANQHCGISMYFPYKRIAAQGPSGAAAQRFSFAGGRLQICCPVISSPVIPEARSGTMI